MCVCMSACVDSCLSARVRVRECVRAHTRGCSARPLDVHPYVHERMCMDIGYLCIDRAHFSMRVRVRECARAGAAQAREHYMCSTSDIYISMHISTYI